MQTIFIPDPIDGGGFQVPIECGFTGIKVFPLIALATNSAFPSLTLFQQHIEYKVFRKTSAKYSNIEQVDARGYKLAQNITLYFKTTPFIFTAQVFEREDLRELMRFLGDKGVALSSDARVLANSG